MGILRAIHLLTRVKMAIVMYLHKLTLTPHVFFLERVSLFLSCDARLRADSNKNNNQ